MAPFPPGRCNMNMAGGGTVSSLMLTSSVPCASTMSSGPCNIKCFVVAPCPCSPCNIKCPLRWHHVLLLHVILVWQSSRPASFSPAGLTLWPSWLERWLATLSGLSVQVRIPVGLPGHYISYAWWWHHFLLIHLTLAMPWCSTLSVWSM